MPSIVLGLVRKKMSPAERSRAMRGLQEDLLGKWEPAGLFGDDGVALRMFVCCLQSLRWSEAIHSFTPEMANERAVCLVLVLVQEEIRW